MRNKIICLRFATLIVCLCMVLLFAGCTAEREETISSEPQTQPPVVEETSPSTTPTVTKPMETVPPETEPPIPEPEIVQLTMTFVGDCTFGRNQKAVYENSFDQYYDKYGADYFFDEVRHIFENDDLTVINLEGSLTTSDDIVDKLWNHKGDPKYVQIMTGSSVEVATMGNNHRLDYGQSGFEETVSVLEKAGIGYCYDDHYLTMEVKGIKVGFVSVNEVYDGWGVKKYLKEGYKTLREQGCDLVIACPHWGGDKTAVIEDFQLSLGYELIDMGYDLVLGNHPHVLQSIQVYKGKFICYSLGNFCYGGSKNPKDKDSGIFQQTFTFVDGELVLDTNGQFIPCTLSGKPNRNDYQPTLAVGEEFQRIIDKINEYSAKFGFALDSEGRPVEKP